MDTKEQIFETSDGSLTLFNKEISECYHSKGGAKWESEALYINSSGIRNHFENLNTAEASVLDVGLGLGYNACSTIEAWMKSSGIKDLFLISLEYDASLIEGLIKNSGSWQTGWSEEWLLWCSSLRRASDNWNTVLSHPSGQKSLYWTIYSGNAREVVGHIKSKPWTHIWQDPFSPEKNPELWTPDWFSTIRQNSTDDCKLMTYSVARQVKDSLIAGGWNWKKIPAAGPKRSWLEANPADS